MIISTGKRFLIMGHLQIRDILSIPSLSLSLSLYLHQGIIIAHDREIRTSSSYTTDHTSPATGGRLESEKAYVIFYSNGLCPCRITRTVFSFPLASLNGQTERETGDLIYVQPQPRSSAVGRLMACYIRTLAHPSSVWYCTKRLRTKQ